MFATALNGLLVAFLTLLPAAAGSDRSPGDARHAADSDGSVVVRLDGDDVKVGGDDAIIVRLGRGAFMGVRLIHITDELRGHYGAPKDAGVLVAEVESGSPASRAGIEVGDVITTVDGERVTSSSGLSRRIRDKKAGETVEVEIVRGRSPRKVTVTLEERKGRSREIDLGDVRDKLRRHAFFWRDGDWKDGDFRIPRFRVENLEELPSLRDRLDELERRLADLEKKLAR